MLGVNPYIAFKGHCRQVIDFYKTALGAEELFVHTYAESPMPDMGPADNIMHCTLKIGDSIVMMCDDPRPSSPAAQGNISLSLGLNDPARAAELFNNLCQGGTVQMPLAKTSWAEAFGIVTDQFGVNWMVNCDAPK